MPITNDETTGRTGVCYYCHEPIEEALLLKGLMVRKSNDSRDPKTPSPGVPTWRRVDRGPGSARCTASSTTSHSLTEVPA